MLLKDSEFILITFFDKSIRFWMAMWCQTAPSGFELWVLDGPPWLKTVGFCDLLGTLYAPVSKIPPIKSVKK